jgi:hypothetical protein
MLLIIGTLPLVAVFFSKKQRLKRFLETLACGMCPFNYGLLAFYDGQLKKGEFAAENMPYKNA